LRDGNHAVSHQLTLENIINYCKIAESAGVPVIEVGHGNGLGASSILVGQSLVDDESIIKAARGQLKNTKLSMHVIPGFATIKKDLVLAVDLGVDIFRIGTHVTEADISKRHIEYVRTKGLTAMGVLMMSHMASIKQLVAESKKMQSYGAQALVIMDSSGHYLSSDVADRISALKDNLDIHVGFHGHNNLGLAIANSVAAADSGADIIDASIRGFGAGAGNAQLEILVAVFERMKYQTSINLYKILDAADLAENTFNPNPAFSATLSIVSGLAGVFSGFAKHVKSVSKDFNVDEKDVVFELGRRGVIAGQESIIYEVAQDLAAKKISEE